MNPKHSPSTAREIPEQEFSALVRGEKYAKGNESLEDIRWRVAKALARNEASDLAPVFYQTMVDGFVPAGRISSTAGTDLQATLINCFVQPVGDSVSETKNGIPGIYPALLQAAETMRRGGGVGYDFSHIRPAGAKVKGTASRASGPVSYMRVYDRSCETVESAGARRGAQMGILRCDHPDIEKFVCAKDEKGELKNFNLSVAMTDRFMRAVEAGEDHELAHAAEPDEELKAAGAFQRDDGLWVYRRIPARQLFDQIMRSTYDHGEPGVFFVDRTNADNNLWYCEEIAATNPCAEQPLPPYGCCCLGSIDLTRFVKGAFTDDAEFSLAEFGRVVRNAVRMLDNVLDVTVWPLDEQRNEATNKRRIGLGFLGLGDALVMLGLRYDSSEARTLAARIAETMRNEAYRASIDLAREKGPFPYYRNEYLSGQFIERLPKDINEGIRQYGIRNSHLLSIAPTGTISLAFADNTSNGIEPAFGWSYVRRKRMSDGSTREYEVEDHAYRVFRHLVDPTPYEETENGRVYKLPPEFVSALEISATDHMLMVGAVAPFIDAAISKTVNIPADYPFEEFKTLYLDAWRWGAKGLATFRPNDITGSVLSFTSPAGGNGAVSPEPAADDPDRRVRLTEAPTPPLNSLRWPSRPKLVNGNPGHTYMVPYPRGKFALFVGHVENGEIHPFEVWVNGAEQPRGLGALAKTLSMDMRAEDRAWLLLKLESLARAEGDDAFAMDTPWGTTQTFPSAVSAMAALIKHRLAELKADDVEGRPTPVLEALISRREPKTGPDGTMAWSADVLNPATGDDFMLALKELVLPNGQRRPYSVWLSGVYPRTLDGLCKSLSFDMRVIDPAWIGKKLRGLKSFPEPQGDFFAKVPGANPMRQSRYPSTIAYLAHLIIHRYAMLGILDAEGYPLESMGVMAQPEKEPDNVVSIERHRSVGAMAVKGKRCTKCGVHAVVKRDGCEVCDQCGETGACG